MKLLVSLALSLSAFAATAMDIRGIRYCDDAQEPRMLRPLVGQYSRLKALFVVGPHEVEEVPAVTYRAPNGFHRTPVTQDHFERNYCKTIEITRDGTYYEAEIKLIDDDSNMLGSNRKVFLFRVGYDTKTKKSWGAVKNYAYSFFLHVVPFGTPPIVRTLPYRRL